MGSSDYNFETRSIPNNSSSSLTSVKQKSLNEHPTASVAAFLSYAASALLQLPSRKQQQQQQNDNDDEDAAIVNSLHRRQEIYQDECALMFLADVLEVSCGPGGVASVKLNFPTSDPGGLNFFRNYAAANGARVESVDAFLHGGGMNQTTAAAFQQMMLTGGNTSNTNNANNNSNNQQQQMAVTSSICILREPVANNNNSSSIVVDRSGPEAQTAAIQYSIQQQQRIHQNGTSATAGSRRTRSSNNNNNANASSTLLQNNNSSDTTTADSIKNPTSALFGYFASTSACSSCPHESLKALLCRRPTLHQLPCCVLLILFASLRNILDQYDSLREQQHNHQDQRKSKRGKNNFVGIVKQEEGEEGIIDDDDHYFTSLSARSLPTGIPFAMKLFCGDSLDGENYSSWEWLWERVAVLNKLLNEGNESFAKVV